MSEQTLREIWSIRFFFFVFEAKRAMEPWPLAFSSNPGKKRNNLNFRVSNRKTLQKAFAYEFNFEANNN